MSPGWLRNLNFPNRAMSLEGLSVISWVAWLLFCLATVGLFWLAGRVIVRLWRSTRDVFGVSPAARLIGLGVSTIIFRRVVPALAEVLTDLVETFLLRLPMSIARNLASGPVLKRDFSNGSDIVSAFTGEISRTLSSFSRGRIPLDSLVLLLFTWCLVGQLQGGPADGDTRGKTRLAEALGRMTLAGWKNIALFGVLGVGLYLSLAAISAVPQLSTPDSTNSEATSDKLVAQLKDRQWTQAKLDERFPLNPYDADPFEALRAKKATDGPPVSSTSEPIASDAPRNDAFPPNIETEIDHATSIRSELKDEFVALRTKVRELSEQALQVAATQYSFDILGRKGSAERVQHFQRIVDWYARGAGLDEERLRECVGRLKEVDKDAGRFVLYVNRLMADKRADPIFEHNPSDSARPPCELPGGEIVVPERPPLGDSLGPLRFIAGWLLASESLPLALIIGMLGFGLLGSAVSTFVREQINSRGELDARLKTGAPSIPAAVPAKPLVDDLAGVVIRGLSAAVVVFLAVEGGLASFSNTSTAPNPYVLFLTCLIAAVFSERVWIWAQTRLNDGLGPPPPPRNADSVKTATGAKPTPVEPSSATDSAAPK